MQAGRVKQVDEMYERAIVRNPRLTSVATQGLRASCYLNDGGEATQRWLAHVRQALPSGHHSHLMVGSLDAVARLQMQGRCTGVTAADVIELTELAQQNPVFRGRHDRQGLSVIRANVLLTEGDRAGAMKQMRAALEVAPDMDTVRALYQLILADEGQEAAQAFLNEVRNMRPPKGRFARQQWQRDLDALGAS